MRSKTAALIFREQFAGLVKDTSSALEVIGNAVQQVRLLHQVPCAFMPAYDTECIHMHSVTMHQQHSPYWLASVRLTLRCAL